MGRASARGWSTVSGQVPERDGFQNACLFAAWLFGLSFFVCLFVFGVPAVALLTKADPQLRDGGLTLLYGWLGLTHSLLCWLACVYMARRSTPSAPPAP